MPALRHKRSQNTGALYALVDGAMGAVNALMRASFRKEEDS
jgi:hypothetical protein